jgi:predicted alpha-1,2-mannosidase
LADKPVIRHRAALATENSVASAQTKKEIPMSNPVKSFFLSFVALFLIVLSLAAKPAARPGDVDTNVSPELTDYVSPFAGTWGPSGWAIGCTVPGVALPFGMVQWSPDTVAVGTIRNPYMGSYLYPDGGIRGFGLNHLSGVCCPIMADAPIMPVAGPVTSSPAVNEAAYVASFSHSNEQVSPGSYAVKLDNGIKVQLTSTTRAGIGRFTFPVSADSNFLFNVGRSYGGVVDASIEIVGDRKLAGSVSGGGFCNGAPRSLPGNGDSAPNKYTVYFVAEFNRPFTKFGTWNDSAVNGGQRSARGPHTGGFVGFDTTKDQVVELKVALSYVSIENAWKNLNKEIVGWDFDAVRESAHGRWNKELGLITVSGGTEEEKRVFYTSLYHSLLGPTVFSDVNGEYMGFDDQVHVANGYTQYANYSGWDI